MIAWLKSINYYFFFLINQSGFDFIDPIMILISSKILWIPFYILILYFLYQKHKKKILKIVLALGILILFADSGSVHIFKNQIKQQRPCHMIEMQDQVRLVSEDCGGEYGFVSSHASNAFAIAFFVSFLFKSKKWFFFLYTWASLIGFSRIYLGVHFPFDIVGGMFWGLFVSLLVYRIYKMRQFDIIWMIWLFLVIAWNFGVPKAPPIADVLVAVILSILAYQYKNYKLKSIKT